MLSRILAKFTQDDFRNDWYGWLTNQIAHIVLGFAAVVGMCAASFYWLGEIPYKWALFLSVAISYGILEYVRGWSIDALEDWVFVSIYGAGFTIVSFSEIEVGSPLVQSNITDFAWLAVIPLAHFAFGVWQRVSDD